MYLNNRISRAGFHQKFLLFQEFRRKIFVAARGSRACLLQDFLNSFVDLLLRPCGKTKGLQQQQRKIIAAAATATILQKVKRIAAAAEKNHCSSSGSIRSLRTANRKPANKKASLYEKPFAF
jgi:hypothetical protein